MSDPKIVVFISPEEALEDGAAWKIEGVTDWETHTDWTILEIVDEDEDNVEYTIKYKTISGWHTPKEQTVKASKDEEYGVSGDYIKKTIDEYDEDEEYDDGTVEVEYNPPDDPPYNELYHKRKLPERGTGIHEAVFYHLALPKSYDTITEPEYKDGSNFSIFIPPGTRKINVSLSANRNCKIIWSSDISEINGHCNFKKMFSHLLKQDVINKDIDSSGWYTGKWVNFTLSNEAKPDAYTIELQINTDHRFYTEDYLTAQTLVIYESPDQGFDDVDLDQTVVFYGWIENDNKVYLGVGSPRNYVCIHDGENRMGSFNGIRVKVYDETVYFAWFSYNVSGYANAIYYGLVTIDGKFHFVDYFTKNLGSKPGTQHIDFAIANGNMHLMWNTCFIGQMSDVYTAHIRMQYVDMNPAHIIRECLTNDIWGMGYSTSEIDKNSFSTAAETLHEENFGLSFIWDRSDSLENVIIDVLKHIDGILYVDIRTGLFNLKLMREDYDVDNLSTIGPDQIIEMKSFDRRLKNELRNTVTINFFDSIINKDSAITLHNYGLINVHGGIVGEDLNFKYISNPRLAGRVGARELKKAGSELFSGQMVCDRSCSHYTIGDVVKLSYLDYGIEEIVIRIMQIQYGILSSNKVVINFVQDVVGLEEATIADSERSRPISEGTKQKSSAPKRPDHSKLHEIPYYEMQKYLQDNNLGWNEIDEMGGFINYAVAKKQESSDKYALYSFVGGEEGFGFDGYKKYTPTAVLAYSIIKSEKPMIIELEDCNLLEKVKIGTYAVIDDEIVSVEEIINDNCVGVVRGILDTVPASHEKGARIWFIGSVISTNYEEYASSDVVNAVACPKVGSTTLPLFLGAPDNIKMDHRYIRPYPPGKFRIQDEYLPEAVSGEVIELSWAHRNRLEQTDFPFIWQKDDSLAPEEGLEYTVYIYDNQDNLISIETGISGEVFQYTREMEYEDSMLYTDVNALGETQYTNFGARYE
ncbi:MAG: hypothetical protein ACOCQD_03080 [archaeon]